jgi:Putative transposase of IS4/5 family (DUF4096)
MAKRKNRAARAAYPSDLTDAQGALIEPLIPPAEPGGRYRAVDMHEVFNGILYLLEFGLQLAHVAPRLAPLGHGALLLPPLPTRRHLARKSMTTYASMCVGALAATPTRARPSWIVSRLRRPKRGARTRLRCRQES